MNKKELLRIIFFSIAILCGVCSWIYTNSLANKLKNEERKNISLWAEAVREIENVDLDGEISLLVYKILQENKTIPAILVKDNNRFVSTNIKGDTSNIDYMHTLTKKMHEKRPPLIIEPSLGVQELIYYEDSTILKQLELYPKIQLAVALVFIIICIIALKTANIAEENRMMVGMSKETAHQLGTPISSLLAWIEILKLDNSQPELTAEVEKDVNRLVNITERFSKIGSTPELTPQDIRPAIKNSLNYLKARTSKNIEFIENIPEQKPIIAPINAPLISWVIENLCKNAIDAMSGKGKLKIIVTEEPQKILINVSDTGKGIPKRNFKLVFKPGYTTKKHGWGLGLSLAARIINSYHKGRIYIKTSDLGKGTTFRIELPKIF